MNLKPHIWPWISKLNLFVAVAGLELLKVAIEKAGYTGKIEIGMDVAASEFCKKPGPKYDLDFKNPQSEPAHWVRRYNSEYLK